MRLAVTIALALSAASARAGDSTAPRAAGVELDLLPPIMSAAAGGVGLSGQVWAGQDRWRVRLVGARILFPDALGPPEPFEAQQLAAAAFIVDRFFEDGFVGPWVGAGAEYWRSSVGHEGVAARSQWTSPVLTTGAGYVWRFWRGLYLNPWGAVHWTAREATVSIAGDEWTPRRISAEVSLKVGWCFGR